MTTLDGYLKDIYYNPKSAASFSGPNKLYHFVKRDGKFDVSRHDIYKWLQKQEPYSLQRQTRKPKRTPIIVAGVDSQWSVDLMDMVKYSSNNDGFKYVLVAIDTFSKYLWLRPLKDKSGTSVAKAFEDIFTMGRKPERIRSDKGQEFKSKEVEKVMEKNNIKQMFTQNEVKASISERVIKTIKSKIARYFTYKNSHRYVDELQNFAKGYNQSYHRTIGMTPSDVNATNSYDVWVRMYPLLAPLKSQAYKFKVGDKVRLTYLRNIFTREYDQKWTGEVFTISERFKRLGSPIYRVVDYDKEPITGTFYQSELQKVDMDDDALFKIEKIEKERGKGNNKEYFVKWLYWPKKFNSWVKASDLQSV